MPPREGDAGRVLYGPFSGHRATVCKVDGDRLRVLISIFGRTTEIAIAAADFEAADATRPSVSATCVYQLNDTVLAHGGYSHASAGAEYVVHEVDEARRRLELARLRDPARDAEDDAERDTLQGPIVVGFDDVTLVSPLRRDTLPDYVAVVRRSAGKRGEQAALQLWAARQVARVQWDPYHPSLARTSALASEYATLESAKWEAVRDALVHAEAELRARFEPLTPAERVLLWKRTWSEWADTAAAARASWTESERTELSTLKDSQRDAIWTLRARFGLRRWDFTDPHWDAPADERARREDLEYESWRSANDPTPPERMRERTEAALAAALARFPAVEAHVARVWGLRLPRHVAVARAFFDVAGTLHTVDPGYPDLGALDVLRFSFGISEGYLLELFKPGALDRIVQPGLDERLAERAFYDPPEMVTVMLGNIDGLHWGLWYDDPRFFPSFVVRNYVNDDPIITDGAATVLGEILAHFSLTEEPAAQSATEEDRLGLQARRFERRLMREYMSAFQDADRDALAHDADGRCPHPRGEDLRGGPGIAAPAELLEPMPTELTFAGRDVVTSAEVRDLVGRAHELLGLGRPVVALAVARELHYRLDHDVEPGTTEALFQAAYQALGRAPLADIARLHRKLRAGMNRFEVFVSDPT